MKGAIIESPMPFYMTKQRGKKVCVGYLHTQRDRASLMKSFDVDIDLALASDAFECEDSEHQSSNRWILL